MASLTPRIDLLEGRANYIINGHMQFAQRNTTFNINNSNAYTLDRWQVYHTGYGAGNDITVAQDTDVPSFGEAGYRFPFSMKLTNNDNAPSTGTTQIVHRIEGYDYSSLHSRYVKIQYWVKSSLVGIYTLGLGNSANNRTYVTEFTILNANTWELKEHLIKLDDQGTWLFANNSGLLLVWALQAGSPSEQTSNLGVWKSDATNYSINNVDWASTTGRTFNITGVQVTPVDGSGFNVIPFATFGHGFASELISCQRYFEKSYQLGIVPGTISTPGAWEGQITTLNVTTHSSTIPFTVRKRTTPTVILYNHSTGASANWATITSAGAQTNRAAVVTNPSEINFLGSFSPSTTDPYAAGHWTAESEL